eukprot:3181484-Rhodomonas_salina.1
MHPACGARSGVCALAEPHLRVPDKNLKVCKQPGRQEIGPLAASKTVLSESVTVQRKISAKLEARLRVNTDIDNRALNHQ